MPTRLTRRLTIRAKLMGIAGITSLAFVLLIVISSAISRRVDRQVHALEKYYVPRIALHPQLEAQFERIWRGFQDAVAASDEERLAATRELKDGFLALLSAARGSLTADETETLRQAVEDYYAAGFDVSSRLLADESSETLSDAMTALQKKQARVVEIVNQTTRFDEGTLTSAFEATRRALAAGRNSRLWIGVGFLLAVALMMFAVTRGLLASVARLTTGFQHFGNGEFDRRIGQVAADELGDLARVANQMAESLEHARDLLQKRTDEVLQVNRELEAFSYSVAHDLRAPLRGMNGFARILYDEYKDKLDEEGIECLQEIQDNAVRMAGLIDALLSLARVTRTALKPAPVDLSAIARSITTRLAAAEPDRKVEVLIDDELRAHLDPQLASNLLENLFGNAWKFTSKVSSARIEFRSTEEDGCPTFVVRDNGAGFDAEHASKLFAPFQRLHSNSEFPGTGIGLATVQRIVHRHGGRIWARGVVDAGATFFFTLPPAGIGELT
jgi:signal transduction histidine kinase